MGTVLSGAQDDETWPRLVRGFSSEMGHGHLGKASRCRATPRRHGASCNRSPALDHRESESPSSEFGGIAGFARRNRAVTEDFREQFGSIAGGTRTGPQRLMPF